MRSALKLAVIAPVAALALLTGCNDNSTPGGTGNSNTTGASAPATTAAAATPETITEASQKALTQPLHMNAKVNASGQNIVIDGDVNPGNNELNLKMTGALPMDMIVTPADVYIKSSLFGTTKWLHLDVNKLKPDSALRQSMDVRSNLGALAGVTEVRETAPGSYEGTVDLQKAADASDSPTVKKSMNELVKQAGANAKSVPFTAKIDDEGRLTNFTYSIKTTAAGEVKTETTLSDFGKTVTVTKPPAAETQEAPAQVYAAL